MSASQADAIAAGLPVGHGFEFTIKCVDALQAAGEEGIDGFELFRIGGLEAKTDGCIGYLAHALRLLGYLVQRENNRLCILPDVEAQTGMWMRHPEYGVVKVSWARDGFPLVKVRKLGTVFELGNEFRVQRSELSGR